MDFRTAQNSRVSSQAQYNEGQKAYMLKVYNYMASALAVTGFIAYFISTQTAIMQAIFGSPLKWLVMLAPLGVVMFLQFRINKLSVSSAKSWFYGYSALMGLSLSSIFIAYTGESIARTFFITSAAFVSLSLYGYTTKKDLSGFGSFLIMGVFGIIIASLVNLFLQSSALSFAISVIGVLVFAGLTAYDTQRIKSMYYQLGGHSEAIAKASIMGALSLYLDFINMFIFLLQFMGNRE